MIASVLIANRGEIARRIIRTARRLGIGSIAVYSEADAGAAHVREADAAVAIGPAPARESYLNIPAILAAAEQSGAQAIHPGYGFLSENAAFAQRVIDSGLIWVGPPPAAILAMGRKDSAKQLMLEAGVPVTPGYLGADQDAAHLAKEAARIGWPVLIKAVAGGGGKGMRKVAAAGEFGDALAAARREAAAAFGDDRVLLEKYVTRPRHIEVQVFADAHGGAVHLFERDCSIQRRHQKVIEEAPAPGMDEATRQAVCSAAVSAARAVDYRGAGTVEFIADASDGLRADRIWFMEMNTRLQVEHPVTEAITGLDLVEWQFRIAAGEPLPRSQSEISIAGHAIEARLYAEDPSAGFLPSTGPLTAFEMPSGVRVDAAAEAGDAVTPHYDPMIAKLISHGADRAGAITALAAACEAIAVWPVKTNGWFLKRCLADADFVAGQADTGFIEARLDPLTARPEPSAEALAAAAGALATAAVRRSRGDGPWAGNSLFGFRLGAAATASLRLYAGERAVTLALSASGQGDGIEVELDGRRHRVEALEPGVARVDGAEMHLRLIGDSKVVVFEAGAALVIERDRETAAGAQEEGDGLLRAPMPGRITSVSAKEGDEVRAGDLLLTLEAMKMEHALKAPREGRVVELAAAEGDQVVEGSVLARLAPLGDAPG
ncbi:MAG TPA: biotin carboxylase N-terminal domain-containing protein [Caulobacteraceae bacterium]|nr:biotin carboxylase N-terminal domain-containing protein [Caulobacteraceae bacterium]